EAVSSRTTTNDEESLTRAAPARAPRALVRAARAGERSSERFAAARAEVTPEIFSQSARSSESWGTPRMRFILETPQLCQVVPQQLLELSARTSLNHERRAGQRRPTKGKEHMRHQALGLALALMLVGCGGGGGKDPNAAAAWGLTGSTTAATTSAGTTAATT